MYYSNHFSNLFVGVLSWVGNGISSGIRTCFNSVVGTGIHALFISKEWLYIVALYTLATIGMSSVIRHTYQYSKYKVTKNINRIPYISKWTPKYKDTFDDNLSYMSDYFNSSLKQIETGIESIQDEKVKTDARKMFLSLSKYFQTIGTKSNEIFDLMQKYRN